MKVTRRRATLDDLEVNLELINQAYKPEGRWKVEERRTTAKELTKLIPDQNLHPDTQNHQILLVFVADEGEDVSLLPEMAQKSRIVAHVRAEVEGNVAFFGMFAVWPTLQGKKIGVTVLDELVKEISESDHLLNRTTPVTTLEADVASENTQLFPLYAKLGFTLTGNEYPLPSVFGPLQPGYEHTTLKTITRELKSFLN